MKDLSRKDLLCELVKYVKENVEDYNLRCELSLRNMDRNRCPMDDRFREEIEEKINEWLFDEIDIESDILPFDEKKGSEPSVFEMISELGRFEETTRKLWGRLLDKVPENAANTLYNAYSDMHSAVNNLSNYLVALTGKR